VVLVVVAVVVMVLFAFVGVDSVVVVGCAIDVGSVDVVDGYVT